MQFDFSHLARKHAVPLIHSVVSTCLMVFLLWFFIYRNPDPNYNDILSVLVGALVTIVTVMFSAVLVALQLGSAQFSPRIARGFFMENRFIQAAFYLFLFGIAYSVGVKFTYSESVAAFRYPVLPVLAAVFGFFLISFVLPRFVFYIADSINAATITEMIAKRTLKEIDKLYGKLYWQPGKVSSVQMTKTEAPCVRVATAQLGFLDTIDFHAINEIAQKYPEWTFYSELIVGNFVSIGETLMKIDTKGQAIDDQTESCIKEAFVLNRYRSYDQDVLFGIRQLVDIGIKAISPAVNDPTTCVNCLHYLGAIVRRYALAELPSLAVRQAAPNVHLREFNFEMLLNASFDQIYQWGKHDYIVVSQLLNTLLEVIQGVENPNCLEAIRKQVADFELGKQDFDLAEHKARVSRNLERLHKALDVQMTKN